MAEAVASSDPGPKRKAPASFQGARASRQASRIAARLSLLGEAARPAAARPSASAFSSAAAKVGTTTAPAIS
jgi:hypothetical protein